MSVRTGRILMIAGAILFALALVFMGLGPLRPGAIETRLAEGVRAALDEAGHDWARVEMNGQTAILTGVAPDEAARADAVLTTRSAVWAGGVVAGGVTRVIDETETPREARGFALRADLRRSRVSLRGDAPDAASRDRLSAFASSRFTGGADADLTLAPGGAPSEGWVAAAERVLGQLARLDGGSAVMIGADIALVGEAGNPAVAQSAAQALSSLPDPYRASVILSPAGAPSVYRIADAAGCGAVIEALRGPNPLRFDREQAEPSPAARRALSSVGEAFAACPDGLALEVSVRIEEGGEDIASERAGRMVEILSASTAGAPVYPALAGRQERRVEFNIIPVATIRPEEGE